MNEILVIGGAGYIGSQMVHQLALAGYKPIIYDNLSTGHKESVHQHELVIGDLQDLSSLENVFKTHSIQAVMHFASYIAVGESVKDPLKYYANNVSNTITLLTEMKKHRVNKIIFSSSAAVYGTPHYSPIDVKHSTQPINPYGMSKLVVEKILTDCDLAFGLKSISLRYFNAAGASPKAGLGEKHDPETHLIPLALQVASGKRQALNIYGRDYPTQDGTCIRDYIHVIDICHAHLLALETLLENSNSAIYNLGTGQGHSVQQVIDTIETVTGKKVPTIDSPKRTGDPAELVADPSDAFNQLGWEPTHSSLPRIITDAWEWEQLQQLTHQEETLL